MIRTLRVARRSAVHRATTQISNQVKGLIVTAPAELREQLRLLSGHDLIETLAGLRPGSITTPTAAAKMALRVLARRHQHLGDEIATLNVELERLTQEVAPELCALKGVGPMWRSTPGGRWRQPREAALRGQLRAPLRRRAPACVIRQDDRTPPTQPRRQPSGQQCPLAHRHRAPALAPADEGLRGPQNRRRALQEGDHPLPQSATSPARSSDSSSPSLNLPGPLDKP